ncbi:MHS family MFS transporter [Amycolatopsis rubida]|uniref:MHS family MFS transporter n=2 Tax=Pseudonocardiaceae TaxID=2070 RepID=A0ABX0BZZ6_9PSEU|nr:MHS family MFS transporter [Amycolatopsis rubida]
MRRVAAASFVGTLIEGYDFVIYGTAAALVFPRVFFPALGSAAALVASLATFGVAFLARPIGGVVFGHLGDRLGRKKTLVTTLVLMGTATVLIGLVPPASQIGVAAPILVVVLRFLQGISQGGEWAGAILFVTEHAPKAKRGFWAMFPVLGATLPVALGNATFLLTGAGMSSSAFLSYGWRIPFLASALLIAVGLYTRLKVDETPAFQGEQSRRGVARMPFVEAFKRQPRDIIVASGVGLMVFSLAYFSSTYLTSYGTGALHLPRTFVLTVSSVGGLFFSAGVVLSAALSDRIGRRRLLGALNILAVVWALVMFGILEAGSEVRFAAVVWVTFSIAGAGYAPLGAFLPEQFHTRYRYTATGIAYNLAGVIGGGIGPILAASLIANFGTPAFAAFLALLALIAAICTFSLREKGKLDPDTAEAARKAVPDNPDPSPRDAVS